MLDVKKLGIKISSLRKTHNYSQEKLAELLSVTPQAISKWENGHALPDIALLPVLAQIFGCSTDDIIMPAFTLDERVEQEKSSALVQQAEHIAKYVISKMEDKLMPREPSRFSDDSIVTAVMKKHSSIGRISINRGKTSRTKNEICTALTITTAKQEIKLVEIISKENPCTFIDKYAFLNDCIGDIIPTIYHIDYDKKAILMEDYEDAYIESYNYDEDNEYGRIIRDNYKSYIRTIANLHGIFWENDKVFKRFRMSEHYKTKENVLAWINHEMERTLKKYKEDESAGNIPKTGELGEKNIITQKEFDLYEDALQFLKAEYPKLIDTRFNIEKSLTCIHGDLHPGRMMLSKSPGRKVIIHNPPPGYRIGLCTIDLAMFVALHISSDDLMATVFKDRQPLLDYYYECLCEKVKDYPYETFMNDYKISVAENLFFPIRLIRDGIFDFRMRSKALWSYESLLQGTSR